MSFNHRALELLVHLPLVAMLLEVLDSPASDLPSLLLGKTDQRPRTTFLALLKAKEMLCAKCSPRVIFCIV